MEESAASKPARGRGVSWGRGRRLFAAALAGGVALAAAMPAASALAEATVPGGPAGPGAAAAPTGPGGPAGVDSPGGQVGPATPEAVIVQYGKSAKDASDLVDKHVGKDLDRKSLDSISAVAAIVPHGKIA